jgi:hypothetical protein
MDQVYHLHHIILRLHPIYHIRDSLLAVYILVNILIQLSQVHRQRQCRSDRPRPNHKLDSSSNNYSSTRYILIRACSPSLSNSSNRHNSSSNSNMVKSCIRNPSLESMVYRAHIWASNILIRKDSRSQEQAVLFSDRTETQIISEWSHVGRWLTSRLKLYIHDYLVKNNFSAVATQFHADAQLGDQPVPVNIPGGAIAE